MEHEYGFANGTLNYIYGRYKDKAATDENVITTEQPLDHIPPLFERVGVGYKKNKLEAELWSLFNDHKLKKDYMEKTIWIMPFPTMVCPAVDFKYHFCLNSK